MKTSLHQLGRAWGKAEVGAGQDTGYATVSGGMATSGQCLRPGQTWGCVLASYSSCNECPQHEWLKMMQICSVTVLEVRSLKSSYQQGQFLLVALSRISVFAFSGSRGTHIPWLMAPSFTFKASSRVSSNLSFFSISFFGV